MRKYALISLVVAGGLMAAAAGYAQISKFRSARLGGEDYVAVSDLARHFGLGAEQSGSGRRGVWRSLTVDADQRDIELGGINHWLSKPILAASGRLWIARVDVLKTIDPVLRPSQFASRSRVRTVILDAGHGGGDRGTRGRIAGNEKDLTLDVSRRVAAYLDGQPINVIQTRTSDRTLALADRTDFARAKRADLFVSIHFNAATPSAYGIETYCLPPKGYPSTSVGASRRVDQRLESGNRYDLENVWLAHCIQRDLIRTTGGNDRGVRRARFQVLRDAPCPAALVELGFVSNRSEDGRIATAVYRDKLARAVANGIMAYVRSTGD